MEIEFKMKKCVIFTSRWCFRSLRNHPFLVGFLCFLIFLHRLSPFMFSLLVSVSPVLISTAVLLGTLLSFGQPNIPEIQTDEKISHKTASVMIVERSLKVDLENVEIMEGDEFTIMDEESVKDGEVVENHYVLIPVNDEHLDLDDESTEPDSSDSERVDANLLNYPSLSTWQKVEDDDEEEEGDDSLDSASDLAESSSPDASMAEIALTLHELHPLLDYEMENNEHSGVGEDDDDEDERGDEEEEAEPVLMWTEEDKKNAMDLGNSEIERNERLENLMLRMRARKNMRMMLEEMKLIDLESSDLDLPFNVPPIRTIRRNPFDVSHDFPGSAPSILLPQHNPFDILSEEKPNFVGYRFQEDLSMFQSRERFFRGQGRFNARPSFFAPNRQENEEITEEDLRGAKEVISEIERVSVGHRSQFSEEEESLEDEDEVENRDVEFHKPECSRVSSSSSLSEASERIFTETECQWPSMLERRREINTEEQEFSNPAFAESTNLRITSEVIHDVQFMEPVYDLSPTAIRNNISSSISSDVHIAPDQVSIEGISQEMENGISNVEMLSESPVIHQVDEHESGPINFSNTSEHENLNYDLLGVDQRTESESALAGAGVIFHVSFPSESFGQNLMDSDLDHDTLVNVNNSPSSPDYIDMPFSASEAFIPRVDLQTIVEVTDDNEIKDGDEKNLVEDFSNKQCQFFTNESENNIDSVEGSSFSVNHAQTSAVNVLSATRSSSSSEENDMREEDKHITGVAKHDEDISNNDLRSMEDASLN